MASISQVAHLYNNPVILCQMLWVLYIMYAILVTSVTTAVYIILCYHYCCDERHYIYVDYMLLWQASLFMLLYAGCTEGDLAHPPTTLGEWLLRYYQPSHSPLMGEANNYNNIL